MKATKANSIGTLLAFVVTASTAVAGTTASMDGTINNSSTVPPMSGGAGAGWHFQVALNYASGLSDLTDTIEKHNPLYSLDTIIPVGLSLYPYYEFANGAAVGMEVGPVIVGMGDASFYVIPVGLDCRYTFNREGSVSPYVRAGVQYAFAGGDFIETGDVGFYAKVGLEFGHSNAWSWGLEAGYSSASVTVLPGGGFKSEDVDPYQFTIGLFARF